jgi:hypothetical protein
MSPTADAMELAFMAPGPRLVAIGSGNLDIVPLLVRLQERGIKVVWVTKRSKLAQDAVPAYDLIINVGSDQVDRPKAVERKPVATAPLPAASKKGSNKIACR